MGTGKEELVVITGASRGVGRATALAIALEHGVRVLAVSRDAGALERLQQDGLALDIGASDAPRAIKAAVAGRRVRALVHCAGLLDKRPMGEHQRAVLERLYAVNVFAPLEITQALVDELDGTPPGHVVHIGSMGGFQDSAKFPGLVAYSASKAALACMAQCLAEEFKDRGIRSNCLALGAVDTEMVREAFPGYQAPVTADAMGAYVARFALEGHNLFNGKVLPAAVTTP
ncbi:MAG TPA: SDR family oxidoreductase [Flavobacteriales bacterium]|nr:SDR family oxidoreductase [Flavobacteriales bacterium]